MQVFFFYIFYIKCYRRIKGLDEKNVPIDSSNNDRLNQRLMTKNEINTQGLYTFCLTRCFKVKNILTNNW